jgi:HK97 family phage prohead protease
MSDKALVRDAARYARERSDTDVEHRTTLAPVTLRAKGKGDSGQTFEGYAAKYNSRTWIGYGPDDPWGFWEQVSEGAFDVALRTADVVCLYNHDLNYMLGRTASGTLRLSSDATGLLTVNDLPDTTVGRDLGVLVARGDVAGMSFSFIPTEENWTVQKDGTDLRTIISVDENLYDVAPCVLPAYGDTTANVRAVSLGRRHSPRPFISIPEPRAQKSEKESDDDDNGAKDHGDEDDPAKRSIMQPEDGSPEIDEPEDWREIQRDMDTRLMLERTGWEFSDY